jgi:Tfp pilus assembly protein PilO
MRARHAARIWALTGLFVALALGAVGWFLVLGPQRAQTASLRDQVTASQDQAIVLQRRLAELKRQQADLPRYKAELAANRRALPAVPGTPDFVRQLQAAGDAAGLEVTGVAVGEPADEAGTGIFAMTITLNAEGGVTAIDRFLDQLQRVQPRAVLIETASVTEASDEDEDDEDEVSTYTLALGMEAFVAPSVGGK